MNTKSLFPTVVMTVIMSVFASNLLAQTNECTAGESTFAADILENTAALCCGKANPTKCVTNAAKRLKKTKNVIGTEIHDEARGLLISLRSNGCEASVLDAPTCSNETSTTSIEATQNIEEIACDLKAQANRKNKLKRIRRALNRAKKYLDSNYVSELRANIKALLTAKNCGGSGSGGGGNAGITSGGSCAQARNPRDGANGNVWKQSDESCRGVFVTHNSAGVGYVLDASCNVDHKMLYTGKGNRDPKGLRDHYRTTKCCSQLPRGFHLRIGSTVYGPFGVNGCSRVD